LPRRRPRSCAPCCPTSGNRKKMRTRPA
jgi:hypothetical protein